jgi:Trk K+ transport system NAD-binding subunit
VIAGYGDVGARLARRLRDAGETVVIIESDDECAVLGRDDGFEVIYGDVGRPEVLKKAHLSEAKALILVTGSDDRNLLAAQHARTLGCDRIFAAVRDAANAPAFESIGIEAVGVQAAVADEIANLVGGSPLSDVLVAPGDDVSVLRFRVSNPQAPGRLSAISGLQGALVILIRRGSRTIIPTGSTEIRFGDVVTVVSPQSAVQRVRDALEAGALES